MQRNSYPQNNIQDDFENNQAGTRNEYQGQTDIDESPRMDENIDFLRTQEMSQTSELGLKSLKPTFFESVIMEESEYVFDE